MNRKGQLDYPLITLVVIIFGLLIFAPVMLKIFVSIKEPVSTQLGNLSAGGEIAQQNFNAVMTPAINFWDKVIISAFALAVVLMFISAIFIDTSPFFIVLYIFISMMLVLFAPSIIDSLDAIYDSASFATEVSYLPFVNSLRNNFPIWLVGLQVFMGIVIYGKIVLFSGGQRR